MTGRPGRWTLRTATTSYTVELSDDRTWLELYAWGPHGIEDGPSPLANHGRTPYRTEADAVPAEYIPHGMRPFAGADLLAWRPGGDRGVWWTYDGREDAPGDGLRLAFTDDLLGLRAVLVYEPVPGTDVIRRWTELSNTGDGELLLGRLDSAGVNIPAAGGGRLTYLAGQWAQEFQRHQIDLLRGGFAIGSTQGIPGHAYAPWLAVQDAAEPDGPTTPTWGLSLAWSGSWHIEVESDVSGLVRVRAGRVPHEGEVRLAPGERLVTPYVAVAHSAEGLDGLARVWHTYERLGSAERDNARPRLVAYNSWEATGFDIDQDSQLELAGIAASMGVELFVVDDGWFTGRGDDTGGLGDWYPDPAAFPDGFGSFVDRIRSLGMDFGLWVEPEAVSPTSRTYAEHPDWVYQLDGRPDTLIRNQLLLDLGRDDVRDFVLDTLDRLLGDHPISYLKWDMNRPPTERGRPGDAPRPMDLDAAHVANYQGVLDHLRSAHPHVTVEGCAAGGARVDAATIARTDLVWPSDNTGPQDRLRVQYGFLHAHAPHLMSSWVTDATGYFDTRPRSLGFRFVTAMAGVLGIGADIRAWPPERRADAARWIAAYKRVRHTIHHGGVHLLGSPSDPSCAVQYTARDGSEVVVLAWNSGTLDGVPFLPGRPDRLRLRGLDPAARYADSGSGERYSGAHLRYAGLPFAWRPGYDAELVVLRRR